MPSRLTENNLYALRYAVRECAKRCPDSAGWLALADTITTIIDEPEPCDGCASFEAELREKETLLRHVRETINSPSYDTREMVVTIEADLHEPPC